MCEATRTHTGKSKKINFNYKKWRSITNKIIFIKVTDIPKIELTQKNSVFFIPPKQVDFSRDGYHYDVLTATAYADLYILTGNL